MKRPLAVIAVAVAVAVAAGVVVVGLTSRDGGETAGAADVTSNLPSGHPSIAAGDESEDPSASAASTETIAQLEARRAEDPSDVTVLLDLGEAYFMGQHLRQAEQAYTQVLASQPRNTSAQVGLAMVWHAQGDSKRAEKSLRAVLKAHPGDQEAHYSLAIVCFSAGRVDEAKQQWQAAARIDPTSTTGKRSQSFVDLLQDQESASPSAN